MGSVIYDNYLGMNNHVSDNFPVCILYCVYIPNRGWGQENNHLTLFWLCRLLYSLVYSLVGDTLLCVFDIDASFRKLFSVIFAPLLVSHGGGTFQNVSLNVCAISWKFNRLHRLKEFSTDFQKSVRWLVKRVW